MDVLLRLLKNQLQQLRQVDRGYIEAFFNFFQGRMVEQNQVIAHDNHGAFILLVGERLLQLLFKMSFCDKLYGQRRIFNRNICAVF